jgi:hypothetical protein
VPSRGEGTAPPAIRKSVDPKIRITPKISAHQRQLVVTGFQRTMGARALNNPKIPHSHTPNHSEQLAPISVN